MERFEVKVEGLLCSMVHNRCHALPQPAICILDGLNLNKKILGKRQTNG